VEASGPAVVPAYKPASPPDERPRPFATEPSGNAEKLTLLWRQRRFLWRVAWKTALAAYVIAWLLPVHYEGITKIVPGENQGGSLGLLGKLAGGGVPGGAASGLGLDPTSILGLKTPGALYVEIMKSRSVQDRLIDEFALRRRYTVLGRWFPHIYESRFAKWLEPGYYNTRKQLKSFTDFDEDKKSGVITVTCTDYDPQTAASICNAYVAALNRLASDLDTSDAHRERVFLEERLKSAKQELDRASLELSQFSAKNAVMDPQNQSRTMMDAAARLQGELIASESELKGLEQIYSSDNIKVRTVRARTGELQAQLKKLMGSSGAPAEAADSANPYPSMHALPMLAYQYSDLYRQAKIQETVYEFLTQQFEMARIKEAKELPTVRVMDPAVRPEKKSGPIRTLITGLSVMLAVALAAFWVIGQNAWQQLPAGDPLRALAAEVGRDLKAAVGKMRRGSGVNVERL
jgi:uncharacterized protein involved in exopolysaccharide biosynthesis